MKIQTRKPLSRKLRFDVFKRDGFQCQYCGKSQPDVVLEVDHIHPVSAEGGNEADNLLTSCFECNRGKAAGLLTVIPQSVTEKSKVIEQKIAEMKYLSELHRAQHEAEDMAIMKVVEVMELLRDDVFFSIENAESVRKFLQQLSVTQLTEAMTMACIKMAGYKEEKVFRYFCGICWNTIRIQNSGTS